MYQSVQDYSNSNLHSLNTLFWLKEVIKKGCYGNESLGLAWHRIKVCQINPFYTTITTVIKSAIVLTWNLTGNQSRLQKLLKNKKKKSTSDEAGNFHDKEIRLFLSSDNII